MERVADGICIRPNAFLLKLLLIARTAKVDITKREVGYYVLNSLDVLQGKANPYEVLEAITQDQKAGIERTIYVPDKKSSYNWQHINEQMNYLELANLIRFTDDKRVILNPNEMPTIELFAADWDKKPAFDVYSYDLTTIEIANYSNTLGTSTLLVSLPVQISLLHLLHHWWSILKHLKSL